jgi:hypothetical protein
MRFYFPDSQDQIDPSFDFMTEERSPFRIRQRDDLYAHEVLDPVPYSGMLVSKAIVDGVAGAAGKYSAQQRQRLYREGIREFFRLDDAPGPRLDTMGDCGAFTYVREDLPPYTVDEVIDFYEGCGFDSGFSLDHVVLGFQLHPSLSEEMLPSLWTERRQLTVDLARQFLQRHAARGCDFEPIGVAQGWSPDSYADSVRQLQDIGYARIALGGMVAQKDHEILAVLEAIDRVRDTTTGLHLLGVTRTQHIPTFADLGVTSFDSTSPFRQAFKDDRDNYYDGARAWIALRVPQVDGNVKLQRSIRAGRIDGQSARRLEQRALRTLVAFDAGDATLDAAVEALRDYERLHDEGRDRTDQYRHVLAAAPWKHCECAVCRSVGIQVIIFRGTERNKRRGFHNLHVFARRFVGHLGPDESLSTAGAH